jgi:hypothetical protein
VEFFATSWTHYPEFPENPKEPHLEFQLLFLTCGKSKNSGEELPTLLKKLRGKKRSAKFSSIDRLSWNKEVMDSNPNSLGLNDLWRVPINTTLLHEL